jgi:PAS domain S-box-containing protein
VTTTLSAVPKPWHAAPRRATVLRYLLAVGLSGLMVAIRVAIGKAFDGPTMILFVIPVILSAYWGSVGPGILATVGCMLGAAYYVLPPLHDLAVKSATDRLQLVALLLIGTLVSAICGLLRRSNETAERVIADLRDVQQALRTTMLRMRLATDATAVGIWEWNLRNNTIWWNGQMFSIYGAPPTADGFVTYETWSKAVEPSELAAQEALLQETVRSLGNGARQFRIVRHGILRDIHSIETVSVDALGQAELVVGTNLDITESTMAEHAIRESEQRFRTLANSIPQLAWVANADGYITWYNERWFEYTGMTLAQMEGWGWQAVHDPVVLPSVMERWVAAIASGEPFEMNFPIRRADGQFRAFLTRVQPLRDTSGKVIQWFGTNTDVDELQQAESRVRELNATLEDRVVERTRQLQEANRDLESFSYSVSHDLRAPLRAMNGFANIVLEEFGPDIPANAARYLDRIRTNGRQMGQLIDDLLAFSRLGRQAMNARCVDMQELVRDALLILAPEHEGRTITIEVGALPTCYGDPALLRQVWVNLLSNAIKYTRGRAVATITVAGTSASGECTYSIDDNGTGFDMQYAHKLFGVFQRLHRVDEFEGTGVGLAIVERVISRHGGRVWAEAEVDRGATFRFALRTEGPA